MLHSIADLRHIKNSVWIMLGRNSLIFLEIFDRIGSSNAVNLMLRPFNNEKFFCILSTAQMLQKNVMYYERNFVLFVERNELEWIENSLSKLISFSSSLSKFILCSWF